jgi:polyhydroxybutyrate depolymerase
VALFSAGKQICPARERISGLVSLQWILGKTGGQIGFRVGGKMTSILRLGAIGAVAAGIGVAASCAAARPVELGTVRSVIVDGTKRTYSEVLPPQCRHAAARCPLVFGFHGGGLPGVSGAQFDRQAKLSAAAMERRFILILPDALGRNWKDGRPEVGNGVDDVAFVGAMIASLAPSGLTYDPARVFATGHSNGGHMSFRLACEMSDVFAAVAPVAANLGTALGAQCRPTRAISVLNIVGVADPISPYGGGEIKGNRGTITSSDATLAYWSRANRCRGPASITHADRDLADRTSIVATRFDRCEGGARVHRISITGAGHVWPGETPGFLLSKLVGRSTRELDATRAVLDFFGV